ASEMSATQEKRRLTLPVSGMNCGACAARLERALAVAPGVDTATVNFAVHRATVEFDPRQTNTAALVGVVHETGYGTPGAVEARFPVSDRVPKAHLESELR